jgi:hypothetical protein
MRKRKKALFDGTNYKGWSIKTKTSQMSKGVWNLVEEGKTVNKIENESSLDYARREDDRKAQDEKAQGIIRETILKSQLPIVEKCKSAKEMWITLERYFHARDLSYAIRLHEELMSITLQDNRVLNMANKIKSIFEKASVHTSTKISEIEAISKVMFLLPQDWNQFKRNMEGKRLNLL